MVWSARARQDLADIIAWITADSPSAAARVRRTILEVVRLLADTSLGRRSRWPGALEWPVRRLPYRVVFTPDVRTLKVLRILHGARDLARLRPYALASRDSWRPEASSPRSATSRSSRRVG